MCKISRRDHFSPIDIGPVRIELPVALAPMSGVTDLPFRRLVKSQGAGLVISEMIASHCMIHSTRRSLKIAKSCQEEFPMAVQLAGHDPEVMAEAARLNQDMGAQIIDLNFGCPVKKVVNRFAGSALMRDEVLSGQIMQAVVDAVDIPVTLKMRLGWDYDSLNAPNMARIAEQSGIRMLTVHGRTRCQLYNGQADWTAVRPTVEATSLPVIVNGDIDSCAAADQALAESGANGVMIGRGIYGRPWFIKQVMHYLATGEELPEPSNDEKCDMVLEHYEGILRHHGTHAGLRMARKHLGWYAKGLRGAARYRDSLYKEEDPNKVKATIADLYCLDQDLREAAA